MDTYFLEKESIYEKQGEDIKQIVKIIANRYIGQNPPHPLTYRAYNRNGIHRLSDYRYNFDFGGIFPLLPPLARYETYAYAWSKLWSDQEAELNFSIAAYGPVMVFVNEQPVFKTNILNERSRDHRSPVKAKLVKGWNSFVLRFIKTPVGFGGSLGPSSPKSLPLSFIIPSKERDGQSGWIYTKPLISELDKLPEVGDSEAETGLEWLPVWRWHEKELEAGQFKRMYSLQKDCCAIGWTSAYFDKTGSTEYTLQCKHAGPVHVFLDSNEVYFSGISGSFKKTVRVTHGKRDIIVKCLCTEKDWGFEMKITDGDREIPFLSPVPVFGTRSPWFYAGPLPADFIPDLRDTKRMDKLLQGKNRIVYWRVDEPGTWIRSFLENQNFGNWSYPLGVTLYGLIETAKAFDSNDILDYVLRHVETCTATLKYAQWDKEQYGAAGLHHHLTSMDCLDDCGSFGSMILELAKYTEVRDYRSIADYIADYIRHRQNRLPDGAFVRRNSYSMVMEDTLWADDLYMSVPFLCRYYQLTGDVSFIDDAAAQFFCYCKYLYRADKKIMSHVFDFKCCKATEVSWGRGNGWVAFSFTELLAALPEDHKDRPRLLEIFNRLCSGYLVLQDEEGMWHQVLTDWESYRETSCTSMFVYAFARGVRYGWLENSDAYAQAAIKAWKALSRISVDSQGNIYGVCRGSGFSFSADYYKNELSWNLNDTHGIGIVMLAGIEALKLSRFLQEGRDKVLMR